MFLSGIQDVIHQTSITHCHWTKKSTDLNLHKEYI
ncbi:hypothetical protein ACO22_08105 [Paracoccidioides brasiliensis]|uniref:Uncharacterized protein n=1 Tax=Paracoccidioides brasiliensis TaxID=121759 RepID=A0A1D2J2S2_PARBR|nr:hypothetical protein ACO22_08105 [Paracoccidioides brasiliensis]